MTLDIRANYGGLALPSPIVIGSCPMTANESSRISLSTAGAGAIVLPSLYEEQIRQSANEIDTRRAGRNTLAAPSTALPNHDEIPVFDADGYLQLVERAVNGSPIPIIASLNGTTANHWVDFASQLESAGAAAIELNIHRGNPQRYDCPREIEEAIVQSVVLINQAVDLPVFVKLGREFTSVCHLATELLSGADAMVLHGRSPDVDICLDKFDRTIRWGLSGSNQLGQTLSSIVRVHEFCPAMSIAACGGMSSSMDVIKSLLAGAEVAMVVSALYREGIDVVRQMVDGLRSFMEQKHLSSLGELRELRPVSPSSHRQREEYTMSLANQPPPGDVQAQVSSIEGDRFGHAKTDCEQP